MSSFLRASICAALFGAAAYTPAAHAADGWDWSVAPYAWFATITTDAGLDAVPPGGNPGDLQFDEVLNKLDGAFEVHVEGRGDHFGVLADFTYLGLQSDQDFTRFATESDLDTRLFDLAATWSPDDDRANGFDVIAGMRYVDVDLSLQLDPVNPAFPTTSVRASDTYTDFLLGARYTFPMSDKWSMILRADGSWGDTEGTWSASATATRATGNGAWLFGWRYMAGTIQPNNTDIDLTMNGPVLGYAFKF
jgi:hypothetical protein